MAENRTFVKKRICNTYLYKSFVVLFFLLPLILFFVNLFSPSKLLAQLCNPRDGLRACSSDSTKCCCDSVDCCQAAGCRWGCCNSYGDCGRKSSCSGYGSCYEVQNTCVKDCDAGGCTWAYCPGGCGSPPPPPCTRVACHGCEPSCPSGQSMTVSGPLCKKDKSSCTGTDNCDPCTLTGDYCYTPAKACSGCTPSCPSGQSTTVSGPLCKKDKTSCTGDNGCGTSCTVTGSEDCYLPENNKVPSSPSTMNILIDGQTYSLSTSATEPKVIKYPSTEATKTNTKLRLPSRTTPSTARGSGYRVEANNYGLGIWADFACNRAEDFCSETENYEHNFNPNTTTLLDVLAQGAEGKIDGIYYNLNQCDETRLYSSPTSFYYRVNHNPIIEDPDPLFRCPSIVNTSSEGTTLKGCSTSTYTGIEANNPLKFKVVSKDEDGVEEIKGVVVWLSKDGLQGEIPKYPAINSTYDYTSPDQMGIMIRQRENSWSNPLVYATDSTYNWGNISSDGIIRSVGGEPMAKVNVHTEVDGDKVIFDLEISFNIPDANPTLGTYPEGKYDISGIAFDEHMLLAGGTVLDQFYIEKNCGSWNIDLRPPVFTEEVSTKPVYSNLFYLLWEFEGTGSNAVNTVVNVYGEGTKISLDTPSGFPHITLPAPMPEESEIGKFTDTNSWNLFNKDEKEIFNSKQDVKDALGNPPRINILDNTEGTPVFFVTGYDQACNHTQQSTVINLNPWMTTKGGFVFSEGNLGANARKFDVEKDFIDSILRRVKTKHLDIGTEFLSSRSESITNLMYPEYGAIRAGGVWNTNSERSSWYEHFSKRFEEQWGSSPTNLGEILPSIEGGKLYVRDLCDKEYCFIQVDEDLHIPVEFTECNKKTLIMAKGDIYIEPDIENGGDDNINGCLFISGGSIYIGAGEYKGNPMATELTHTGYDYLDAFLLAENIIDIQLVDMRTSYDTPIYIRDGLEIYGGLVAFGRNLPTGRSAVQVNRSFGLWNTYLPTVATTWDPRYAKLAEIFFGPAAAIYKREIGFKPY